MEREANKEVTSLKYSSSMVVKRFSGQSEITLNFLSFSLRAFSLMLRISDLFLRLELSLVLGILPSR